MSSNLNFSFQIKCAYSHDGGPKSTSFPSTLNRDGYRVNHTGGTGNLNNTARNKKKTLLNSFRYKNGMGQSRSIVIEKGLGRNIDKRNSIPFSITRRIKFSASKV